MTFVHCTAFHFSVPVSSCFGARVRGVHSLYIVCNVQTALARVRFWTFISEGVIFLSVVSVLKQWLLYILFIVGQSRFEFQ